MLRAAVELDVRKTIGTIYMMSETCGSINMRKDRCEII